MTAAPDMAGWLGLAGKLCVVTGAGGGVGRAVARGIARAGARLALLDRDGAAMAETLRQVQGTGEIVPVGRVAVAEDVADAVLFLAGEPARYISGDEIAVDGGFTRALMGLIPRPGHGHRQGG